MTKEKKLNEVLYGRKAEYGSALSDSKLRAQEAAEKKKVAKERKSKDARELVKAKVLKPFGGHKKGDIILVHERKLRQSARDVRNGYYKKA